MYKRRMQFAFFPSAPVVVARVVLAVLSLPVLVVQHCAPSDTCAIHSILTCSSKWPALGGPEKSHVRGYALDLTRSPMCTLVGWESTYV